jgi:hypothetical protein
MRFQLPQQTKNESFDQEFCNEAVYGSCNVLEVTGLVCLPSTFTWSSQLLAVCMLSHESLGAQSTLGTAGALWIERGSSEGVISLVLRSVASMEEDEDKVHEKTTLTAWPTKGQKAKTLLAAKNRMMGVW